jgi:chromosomal replication initiator protein
MPLFNPKYTFDSFVTGRCNELAYAAALKVSEHPGQDYNPLYLYGGPGLGKTHLLQAIGHAAVANNLRVVCVTAEQYTNDVVNAMRERQMTDVQQKYRSADMLLIEDVQFFSGKQKTGENFFHTFDELHNSMRQIVLTSDRPPRAIPLLPERLTSRLEGGLVTAMEQPDYATRLAILKDRSEQDGVPVNHDVLEFLAAQIRENIRMLEGSLNRVIAYSKLVRSALTPEMAAQAIRDIAAPAAGMACLTAGSIIGSVSRAFQVDPADLCGPKRDKSTSTARRVAMYVMRHHTGFSLNQIGKELGGRDAAAVTNSCKKVSSEMELNPFLKRKILDIQQDLSLS